MKIFNILVATISIHSILLFSVYPKFCILIVLLCFCCSIRSSMLTLNDQMNFMENPRANRFYKGNDLHKRQVRWWILLHASQRRLWLLQFRPTAKIFNLDFPIHLERDSRPSPFYVDMSPQGQLEEEHNSYREGRRGRKALYEDIPEDLTNQDYYKQWIMENIGKWKYT